jgi:hypothetical protein
MTKKYSTLAKVAAKCAKYVKLDITGGQMTRNTLSW